jgi:hypothetical protein
MRNHPGNASDTAQTSRQATKGELVVLGVRRSSARTRLTFERQLQSTALRLNQRRGASHARWAHDQTNHSAVDHFEVVRHKVSRGDLHGNANRNQFRRKGRLRRDESANEQRIRLLEYPVLVCPGRDQPDRPRIRQHTQFLIQLPVEQPVFHGNGTMELVPAKPPTSSNIATRADNGSCRCIWLSSCCVCTACFFDSRD